MAKNEPNKPDDMKTVPANETQAEEKATHGNKPLMGNCHVRFLEGKGSVSSPTYSTIRPLWKPCTAR